MLYIAALLALLAGVVIGLLGGGGSTLTVPILVYAVGLRPKEAIPTSLLIVALTSIGGLYHHAQEKSVHWRVGFIFGMFAMAGAYLGGLVAKFVPGDLLMVFFASLMIVAGLAMSRRGESTDRNSLPTRSLVAKFGMLGVPTGFITGLAGAGGGFVVVPTLVLLAAFPMRLAVGTALLVTVLNSIAGFLGHVQHATVNYWLVAIMVATAMCGAVIGSMSSHRVKSAHLKKGFAVFVFLMAGAMLFKHLPRVFS